MKQRIQQEVLSSDDIEKIKHIFKIIPAAFNNENINPYKNLVTLRVFIDEYLFWLKSNRSTAYTNSVKIAFNHLTDFFGLQKPLQLIQLKEIEIFISRLKETCPKGYTVYFRSLKAAFNKAIEWDYLQSNYFTKIKLAKRQKLMPAFINGNQLSVICDQIKNDIVQDVVRFAFHAGLRLDEIVNLNWKNVDLVSGVIVVGDDEFTTKSRKQRFVPVGEEVRELLMKRMNERGKIKKENVGTPSCVLPLIKGEKDFCFVFCKENGERFTGNYFSKRFKAACRAAGMNDSIHFHSLRHSFASNLVQNGVPLYTVKELLGHSSIATTEIYSHLNMDTLRDAIRKLDGYLPTPCVPLQGVELLPPLHLPQRGRTTKANDFKIYRINEGVSECHNS